MTNQANTLGERFAMASHAAASKTRAASGVDESLAWEALQHDARERARAEAEATLRVLGSAGFVFSIASSAGELCDPEALELLAVCEHDRWSKEKMSQGWVWGPVRHDIERTHPGLTDYERLPETEKEKDRIIARAVLTSMRAAGLVLGRG